METLLQRLGIETDKQGSVSPEFIHQYINLRLAAMGLPAVVDDYEDEIHHDFLQIIKGLIANYKGREEFFTNGLCPADERIQNFLNKYFESVQGVEDIKIPNKTFTLDNYGVARELSIPKGEDKFISDYVYSYKIKQGILHNPLKDKRTTKGVFHVAEGGLPIPYEKKAVPINVAKYILAKGFSEKGDILKLPYMSSMKEQAKTFVSLLLRPIVCPEVKGVTEEKTLEIRFFAPGSLVSSLDFVESIFGNAGSPYHLENDAALDILHWTGHTGCIILAPQLTKLKKKEVGLPHISQATDRQKRDGMCWEKEDELYNDGQSFKLTVRTDEGIIVSLIADNYFGYSKKEVKTMIGYSSNLFGNTEEEHSGGALVFPAYNQGDYYIANPAKIKAIFQEIKENNSDKIDFFKEGYGIDKKYKNIYYLPENVEFNVQTQKISWKNNYGEQQLKLLPNRTYILPNGSKFRMEKYSGAVNYRLVEVYGEGLFCHKPCTVSGGGKSEISKSIQDAIIGGSFFVNDFENDFKKVEEIINYDYSKRFKGIETAIPFSRGFLNSNRSMGSVIKLLTPSVEFTDEYNNWLKSFPQYIKGIAFIVKRFYKTEWGNNWKSHFSVDILNGSYGNELKFEDKKIFARYLRVGFQENEKWRTFKLRQDYVHADKIQMEDDITASTVIPTSQLCKISKAEGKLSVKITENCEFRLFQRPDEAIVRGYDKKAEQDLSTPNTFISNFEPLTIEDAKEMVEDVINFDLFTDPMRNMIEEVAEKQDKHYFVSSAHPRLVNEKPTANVRYLQTREDLINPEDKYIAEMGIRIARKLKQNENLYLPVNVVLPGRRNNPASKGVRPLAVYNPVHFQELPELFMDFICSLTGKSPSTTGAGSEGALTKAPFNSLCAVSDLNNALLSFILTGYNGFTTPAGYIGKNYKINHDLSLLIPELWSRLLPKEIEPKQMIENNYLEKLNDFEYKGKIVKASVLGYRITKQFVNHFFGRVFENPNVVFEDDMLQPELQNMDEFVDGINNIVENQAIVAKNYFEDGSVQAAIPPLKALLHIMVYGDYEGKTIESPEIRDMFQLEYVLSSSWYKDRLKEKQNYDTALWTKHKEYINNFLSKAINITDDKKDVLIKDLEEINLRLEYYKSPEYLESLIGTIGKDILYRN
jgi:phosphoenolpyruvate carboxykinase (diphosphate)